MISRKLVRTDLNLLVALQILIEERNVTRAAERLSVSQPALSKTLQKLRAAFDDELFTRTAHGLVPTPRAEVLARDLPGLLEAVESVLGNEDFDPQTYVGGFKLLLPPIVSESLLPALMADLRQSAPNVQIVTAEVPSEFDLKSFLAYPHLRLYLPGLTRENTSMVDDVLGQYGVHRDIVLETTQFASAVGVVTHTDSLLVANAGFEEGGLYRELIVGRELPEELQRMIRNTHSSNSGKMSLMRHTRTSRSAPHQWLRSRLMKHLTRSDNKVEVEPPRTVSLG